jgi:hypothetical protein
MNCVREFYRHCGVSTASAVVIRKKVLLLIKDLDETCEPVHYLHLHKHCRLTKQNLRSVVPKQNKLCLAKISYAPSDTIIIKGFINFMRLLLVPLPLHTNSTMTKKMSQNGYANLVAEIAYTFATRSKCACQATKHLLDFLPTSSAEDLAIFFFPCT